MPDRASTTSKTGEMPAFEPQLRRDSPRPHTLPEMPDDMGSTTGNMPPIRELADDSAQGDDDRPA